MLYVAIPKFIVLFLLRVHPKVFVMILFSFFLLFLPEFSTRNIPLILNVNQIYLLGRVCFASVLSYSYEKFLYLSRSLNSILFFFFFFFETLTAQPSFFLFLFVFFCCCFLFFFCFGFMDVRAFGFYL